MSAFVVSDQTLRHVVKGMKDECHSCEDLTAIGRRLLAMNNDAVRDRYRDADQTGMTRDPESYEYLPIFPPIMYILKAMDCYLYQCAEGNIPERDLYRDVKKRRDAIRAEIIRNLPEYDAVPWDFAA